MFARVHCSAEKSEKSILRHLFSEEAPNPAPPLEEGPIFESPKQKTGTEKAYPYKHFFRHRRRTNIYRRPVLRPTRTNICRVSWAKHFAGQTFFRGGGGPLLAAARAPPDVCTSNVCTGLPLAEEGRCWDREMFVRVGCTRPVQTFRGPNIAPPPRGADPYKHSTYKHPEERARRRGAGPLLPEKMFGPRNVWPTRLCKCLYGSASKRVGDKCLYVSGVERNVCTGKPFPSLFSAWDFRKWAPPPEAAPDLAPPPKKGGAELIFRIFPPNSGPVQTFFSPPPQTPDVCTGARWQMFGPH